MLRADRKANRLYRFCVLVMWFLPIPFLVDIAIVTRLPVPLLVQAVWSVPMWILLSFHKKVILTETGIYSYTLFRNKIYPWNQIIQAGVLWRMGRTERFNEIVLLKQGGSPRKFRDDLFLLRNLRKAIRMDDNPEVRAYISQYYGPLDFDLADGKPEKSRVDESLSAFIESNH